MDTLWSLRFCSRCGAFWSSEEREGLGVTSTAQTLAFLIEAETTQGDHKASTCILSPLFSLIKVIASLSKP